MRTLVGKILFQCNINFVALNLFLVPPTFAFMIGDLPPEDLPAQSCRILLTGPSEIKPGGIIVTSQTSCSATIIGRNQLLTAAHCFVGKTIAKGEVFCPGDTPKTISTWNTFKNFVTPVEGKISSEQVKFDLALVRVDEPFKTQPVRIAKSLDDVRSFLERRKDKKDTACVLSGYGLDRNDKSGNFNGRKAVFSKNHVATRTHFNENRLTGKRTIVRVEHIFDWFNDSFPLTVIAEVLDEEGKPMGAVRHGDSGGGLICKSEDGSALILGVISTTGSSNTESGQHFSGSLVAIAMDSPAVMSLLTPEENMDRHESDKTVNVH